MTPEVYATLVGVCVGGAIGFIGSYIIAHHSNNWLNERMDKEAKRKAMENVLSNLNEYAFAIYGSLGTLSETGDIYAENYKQLSKTRDNFELATRNNMFWIEKNMELAKKLEDIETFYGKSTDDIFKAKGKKKIFREWKIKEFQLMRDAIAALIKNMD